MLPLPPMTQALMLICTAVLCVNYFVPLGLWLALWPLGSGNFGIWQLVTYAFLHADVLHLFFNMLALWMFGSELERLWGQRRYLQMLLASVINWQPRHSLFGGLLGANDSTPSSAMSFAPGLLGLLSDSREQG